MRIPAPARALALTALLSLLTGCPGTLDNADEFQRDAVAPDTTGQDTVEADTADAADGSEPSCAPETIMEDIFMPVCGNNVACHGDFSANGLNLTEPDVASRVFGVTSTCNGRPLAVSGDPAASFLWEKLTSPSPECGVAMPVGITMTQEQLDCVSQWIERGPQP